MKPFLFVITLFFALSASAQTGRWSLALTTGPDFPLNPYAHFAQNFGTGNVRNGWDIQGRAGFETTRGWGIDIMGGYQRNRDVSTSGEIYDTWRVVTGPTYRLRLGGPWSVKARLLVGLSYFAASYSYQGASDSQSDAGFTWGGGAEIRYAVNRRWFLLASADYLLSQFGGDNNSYNIFSRDHSFDSNSLVTGLGLGLTL